MGLNRDALELVLADMGDLPPYRLAVVTLARSVADELDNGETSNAALVRQYRDLLGDLNDVDGDVADPIAELLAELRNPSPSGEAEPRRKGGKGRPADGAGVDAVAASGRRGRN